MFAISSSALVDSSFSTLAVLPFAQTSASSLGFWIIAPLVLLLAALFVAWLTVRCIPNNLVGVVEKLWSASGSVSEGRIIALDGEAGYQAELLRGGIHFGYFRWQYRIHKVPLVTIRQGRIGYVYARDGESLPPSQTLGRVLVSNNFQDARKFLGADNSDRSARGQRGRQRAILREGVYAINPALFVVMTEGRVYGLRHVQQADEARAVADWAKALGESGAFQPVVVGSTVAGQDPLNPEQEAHVDGIAIVTIFSNIALWLPSKLIGF
jgi:hypothetical protein